MSESCENSGDSWWGDWVQSAKEKSLSVLNVVKHDLGEFTSVMHEDGTKVASAVKEKLTHENASAASEKVKHGVSSLLGGLSKVLVVKPDDDFQPARIVDGEAVVFDRAKARLHTIQIDPSTYTTEPTLDGKYEEWFASSFNLELMKGDISDLLVSNVEVRALYTQLVPFTVSNLDFWRRYFFRKHLLEEDEARRVELMKRADITHENADLGWDEDDDLTSDPKISSFPSPTKKIITELKNDIPTELNIAPSEIKIKSENKNVGLVSTDEEFSGGNDYPKESVLQLGSTVELEQTETSTLDQPLLQTDSNDPRYLQTDEDNTVVSSPDSDKASSQEFDEKPTIHGLQESGDELLPEKLSSMKIKSSESSQSPVPSLSGWSVLSDQKIADEENSNKIELTTGRRTPSSDENSNAKESSTDDWEKDFDVEVTEEDLQIAREAASRTVLGFEKDGDIEKEKGDDWEEW